MEIYVDAHELLAAAKFLDAKHSSARPILNAIHVVSTEDGYVIESTDSYKIIRFTNNSEMPMRTIDGGEFSCIISADIIKHVVKASDKYARISCDAETSSVVTIETYKRAYVCGVNMTTACVDGNYPPTDKFLSGNSKSDGNYTNIARLNAGYVSAACNAIELAYGKNTHVDIRFGAENEPVFFGGIYELVKDEGEESGYKDVRRCDGVIMPIRM